MSFAPPPPPPSHPEMHGGPLASWGSRAAAYIVDWLVVAVPAGVLYVVGGIFLASGSTPEGSLESDAGGIGFLFIGLGGIVALVIALWNQGYKQGTTGQSIGKGMLNIETVDTDGQYLGFGMAVLRTLLMSILGSLCVLNYLWPLWDDENRAWHDMIMTTRVRDRTMA
ncbi:RDD family protein [Salsipaludibacter albus]|uniref:RDD family protein n=1 Tax=Salsipaludibacter albus TaxID=2849650 RepID=UPI001EE48EAD|nr:RDD family protein [Salsipaludibacter albus]MBY5162379.1 RDD family protein [Salsipaludibacter albus]